MRRRGRAIATLSVAIGVVVLVAVGFAAKDCIREVLELRKLETGNEEEKASAARLLGGMGSLRSIPTLLAVYEDEENKRGWDSGKTYAQAISEIIQANGEAGIPYLVRGLEDGFESRMFCADRLAQFGCRANAAIPSLIEALQDNDPWIRVTAVQALRAIDPTTQKSMASLMKALGDNEKAVAFNAALTLLRMDPPCKESVTSMREFLNDEDEGLRRAAAEALRKIQGKKPNLERSTSPATGR